jgi:hypothetical protein
MVWGCVERFCKPFNFWMVVGGWNDSGGFWVVLGGLGMAVGVSVWFWVVLGDSGWFWGGSRVIRFGSG